jgi:hypothetical protein
MALMGADITGSRTSHKGRKGREEVGTAEYAEHAEGEYTGSPMTNTLRRNIFQLSTLRSIATEDGRSSV